MAMQLFHGSNQIVEKPAIVNQTRGLDFGKGFYTTSNKNQAVSFTKNVARRTKTISQYVSVYEFDVDKAEAELSILRFDDTDENWLDFVYQNRFALYTGQVYDIVIGPVANDDVFPTLQAYFSGAIPKDVTIAALKIRELFDQYLFTNENALSYINFVSSFAPNLEVPND